MTSRIRRLGEGIGTSLGIVVLLTLGFTTGGDLWTVVIDPIFVRFDFFEGEVYVGVFSVAVATFGFLLGYDVWFGGSPNEKLSSGPRVRAIVPAYRDAEVVDESVTSLLENDYEPSKSPSSSNRTTTRPKREPGTGRDPRTGDVSDQRRPRIEGDRDQQRGRTQRRRSLRRVRRGRTGFPEFVSTAMGELTDGTDVFQGRRVPRPSGPVETLAYCERVVVQAGYLASDLVGFTHCQSSATGFTREAFDAVGGFANVLTEDIYFSHQCHRADLTVTANRHCTSSMEAPTRSAISGDSGNAGASATYRSVTPGYERYSGGRSVAPIS